MTNQKAKLNCTFEKKTKNKDGGAHDLGIKAHENISTYVLPKFFRAILNESTSCDVMLNRQKKGDWGDAQKYISHPT